MSATIDLSTLFCSKNTFYLIPCRAHISALGVDPFLDSQMLFELHTIPMK